MLKFAGGAYLLYLAWRIASSRSLAKDGEASARPMTLLEAAAFQWVNPKAWVMAVTAMAVYTNPERPFLSATIVVVAFTLVEPAERIVAGRASAWRCAVSSPIRSASNGSTSPWALLLAATLWPMLIVTNAATAAIAGRWSGIVPGF